MKLWDVVTGNEKTTLGGISEQGGYSGNVWSVAFCENGKLLAVAGEDWLTLWDISISKERWPGTWRSSPENQAALGEYKGMTSIAFSGDGKLLASGGSNSPRLWDIPKQTEK